MMCRLVKNEKVYLMQIHYFSSHIKMYYLMGVCYFLGKTGKDSGKTLDFIIIRFCTFSQPFKSKNLFKKDKSLRHIQNCFPQTSKMERFATCFRKKHPVLDVWGSHRYASANYTKMQRDDSKSPELKMGF